jgi:hypothetical protein
MAKPAIMLPIIISINSGHGSLRAILKNASIRAIITDVMILNNF